MGKEGFTNKIILGISSHNGRGWKKQLEEIKKYKINEAAVFIQEMSKTVRNDLYGELIKSGLKKIPLVHIGKDTTLQEVEFFKKNFKTKYFTIHESDFPIKSELKKVREKLFLEMNFDNYVPKSVQVEEIGGFCIDLSHFKVSENAFTKDFLYVLNKRKKRNIFKCNHVNGYSEKNNLDMHTIKSVKDLVYLKSIPKFLLGNVIAMECHNSIKEQLKYRKYIARMLNHRFK